MTVQFDGTELISADYMTQFVKHESAPVRSLTMLTLTREPGSVLVGERYGEKIIQMRGVIKASSQANCEAAIDAFKELFSRAEKNLDITWNGGTRRYIATVKEHTFDRDHFHINAVPWAAEFVVAEGIGRSTSVSTPISASSVASTLQSDGSYSYTGSFTMTGSKADAPLITIELTSAHADILGIEFLNVDTNERILITKNVAWNGLTLEIDCAARQCFLDGVSVPFIGLFPRFKIGTNNFKITTGGIVNQESAEGALIDPEPASLTLTSTNVYYAIGFRVPRSDDTFKAFRIGLSKSGTPSGNIFLSLKEDDGTGAAPDYGGTTLASVTILKADIPTYPDFEKIMGISSSGPASLVAGERYWLIVGATGASVGNSFSVGLPADASYPRGKTAVSSDGGSSWGVGGDFPSFKILMGGAPKATNFDLTIAFTPTFL